MPTYRRWTTPQTNASQLANTTYGIPAVQRKTDISSEIWYVRGDLSPFLHLAKAGMFRRRQVVDPKFQQFEQPEHEVFFQNTVTATGTTGTTLTVNDSNMLKVDDRIMPLDGSGQVARVTAIDSTTSINVLWYTSTGAFSGTGTTPEANVNDNTYWINLGNASKEGSTLPSILQPQISARINYTETMRYPFGGTRHRLQSQLWTGRGIQDMARQEWFKAKRDIEHKLMFGVPTEHVSGSTTYRSTGGLWYWITQQSGQSTNYASATFDFGKFINDMRDVFAYGSDTKILLGNPAFIGILDKFKLNKLQMYPGDSVFGLKVNWIETNFGRLMVVNSQAMEQPGSYGAGTLNAMAFIVDPDFVDYCYFDEDLHIEFNKQQPDYDGTVHEYIGDVGICVNVSQAHSVLYGINSVDFSAISA